MPRFTSQEKSLIQEKLMTEGEQLFTRYGLRKVTVDDLVGAAGISKGSFYAFYQNKEHLFMAISAAMQNRMWQEMRTFLQEHRTLPPKPLMKTCFLWMFEQLERYPMLLQAGGDTAELLYRRLPPEVLQQHSREDAQALSLLEEYGIHLACDMDTAVTVMQTLAVTFIGLRQDHPQNCAPAMELILTGVVNEMVADDD